MTEQSKIPMPPEGEKRGKSLFERAEGAFGLGDFKPAPMPAELPLAPRRARQPAKPATAGAEPIPGDEPMPPPSASVLPPEEHVAELPPAPRPLVFSGSSQAIDRLQLRESGLIVPDGQVTQLLEEFRILKRQVLLAARDAQRRDASAPAQRVLVCSPLPGEGKTFTATNLALAIAAEKDTEVVLVDADFAKPSILSLLGLSGGAGLMDALANPSIAVEDCVIGTDIDGLYVLPAGNQTATDSEYLSSSRTAEVLGRLTRGAPNRIVIFDSPPALAASPAAELAKHVGQALVVARADRTGQSALEDTLSLLSACPDIKLVLNAAHFSPSGRRFGAYYGYGE